MNNRNINLDMVISRSPRILILIRLQIAWELMSELRRVREFLDIVVLGEYDE